MPGFDLRAHGAGLATVALILCGCSANTAPPITEPAASASAAAPRSVSPDDFARAVAEPDRVTINVHIPYEGEIAGTDLEIPYDEIEQRADQLPQDRSTALAVYCRSGPMSRTAMDTLARLGYSDIVELDGGMRAWTASGRSLDWR